jgi:CHASE2 domain-containing sensor protein
MGFLLIVWGLMGLVCALIARSKNRSAIGWFILGIFFGPIGILAAAVMSPIPKGIYVR